MFWALFLMFWHLFDIFDIISDVFDIMLHVIDIIFDIFDIISDVLTFLNVSLRILLMFFYIFMIFSNFLYNYFSIVTISISQCVRHYFLCFSTFFDVQWTCWNSILAAIFRLLHITTTYLGWCCDFISEDTC